MTGWIADRSDLISLAFDAAMVGVWIVYLQVFLMTFLRQNRSELLIAIGATRALDARCIVVNLGMQPVYISDVAVGLEMAGKMRWAVVTDPADLTDDQRHAPLSASKQG